MLPVYNGDDFLKTALNSILSQSYSNIEIIILDNQSTDKTSQICKDFSNKDKRIRYILDSKKRTANEAQTHLATLINGNYCMVAGDDDKWDKDYISILVSFLERNSQINMVYSRMFSFDVNDNILESNLPDTILLSNYSIFKNLSIYLCIRSCVPMVFGLFRSEKYIENIPWKIFDHTLTDVDNLFMINFLSKNKTHCISESLFFYRSKDRSKQKEGSANEVWQINSAKNKFSKKIENFFHEILFFNEILKIIFNNKIIFYKSVILMFIALFVGLERTFLNISRPVGKMLKKLKIVRI